MNALLLLAFAAASCELVVWGLRRVGRIYQYPFLAGAVWVGWLLPQAIGLVNDETMPEGGYAITMLMAILCVAATFAGYTSRTRPLRAFAWRFSSHRLLIGAIALSLFGSLFNYLIHGLPDELLRPESGAWTGLPTIYYFFSQAQIFGFAIAALHFAKTRSPLALAVCLYDLTCFADIIIAAGRRRFAIEVALILLLSVWFGRRWIVPRWLAGVGVALATLAVTSIGYWRGLTNSVYGVGGRLPTWEEFTSIDFVGNFLNTMQVDAAHKELYAGIQNIAATQLNASYDLGASYWNHFVFRYVPAQLVGSDLKQALSFDLPNQALQTFGYVPINGSTLTGLTDSFQSFWFFGAIVFFVIARIMRKLYEAGMQGHIVAQLGYMLVMGNALQVVTHSTGDFFTSLAQIALFTLPVLAWARIPATRSAKRSIVPPRPRGYQRVADRI